MLLPRQLQRLPTKDLHDETLDSYDQHRFAGIMGDLRKLLEERIMELSRDLPAMPLPNGSYPRRAKVNRPVVDIIDGVGSSSEEEEGGQPLNSIQHSRLFIEQWMCRLRHLGRLPSWLHAIKHAEGGMERDNLFRGMYGPGFAYDPCTNVVYADCEAVDAARSMVEGLGVNIPTDMNACPNPHGFPMTVRDVQESVTFVHMCRHGWQSTLRLLCEFHRILSSVIMHYRDLSMHEILKIFEQDNCLEALVQGMPPPYFIPLDPRFRRTGPDSMANGAGLVSPVNRSLNDWCQYTAHHFRPSGLNPTSGITMDASYHVSYANVWGMLLMRFLHPSAEKKFYV